ncbi:M56 family metallopeptidase [Sphingomonas sp. R-74633]|uniref:M56 family metallopeptidase n=1 Tax=Sphingomonas sp. R-74633 TaxID=2751188 RepID=UPI0015D17C85|nr:M56 family metallopeptidase [Sphingomonas sp. R-74633]NYT42697.1 M56 family metallopeptidase [Sphingomonas sp. R-74633]
MIASLLIELGWKSALACAVALLASGALRGRPAAQRVAMLRAGIAALLLLPLLILTVPALEIAVLPAVAPLPDLPMPEIVAAPVAVDAPEIDWIALAYGAGAAFVLLRLAIGLVMLHRWTRHAVPASNPVWLEAIARAAEPLKRPVRLLVSPSIASPLSLGVAPATILIGPDTERCADRAAAVIAHEMAHVRRFDWPAMLAARLALALFWFNPLAWLLAAELSRQTELAADEEAVRHVARTDYAQALLAVAGGCGAHAACGMAVTRSALARRIRRVLDARQAKPASGLLCAALIGSIPLGIAPLAAMQLVPAPAAPAPEPVVKVRQSAPERLRMPASTPQPVQAAPEAPRPRRAAAKPAPAPAPVADGLKPPLAMMRAPETPEAPDFKARFQARMTKWRLDRQQPDGKPAPGTEASRQAEATGLRMAKAAVAAKPEDKPLPVKTVWGAGPDARGQVQQRIRAASQLRAQAQTYSKLAKDESLSPDIRQSYVKVAESLRDNASRLEAQARQMKGVF